MVRTANTKKSTPPISRALRSEMYFPRNEPPTTAIIEATRWPEIPPTITPNGLLAAARATVASIDLSPHSARKIKLEVSATTRTPVEDFGESSAEDFSARTSFAS